MTGDTDFSTQVNLGVEKSSHDWVTILEFDDEYRAYGLRMFINILTHIPK